MEQTQVSFAKETHRCPYCHESVDTSDDEWVACKQCLARHHVACWTEGQRCASCQGGTPLVTSLSTSRFRPLPTADLVSPIPEGVSADAIRFVTSQALDDEHRRSVSITTALLTPITLGTYPLLASESAFSSHCNNNKSEERPIPNLSREILGRVRFARELAYDWSRPVGVLRAGVPCLVLVIALIVLITSFVIFLNERDYGMLELIYLCQLWALGAAFAYLHVFRETVRRHEFHQFFAKLVTEAVPPPRAKEVMKATRHNWNGRRALDAFLTLLAGIPFLGLALLPAVGARMRGALLLHEKHEEAFPRRR